MICDAQFMTATQDSRTLGTTAQNADFATPPETPGNPARCPAQEMKMIQDGKSLKMPISADLDGSMVQLQTLREDVTKLTQSAASAAENRGRKMASDISDGVSQAVHYVERKSVGAEAELEKSVATHPLMALGSAAGIGLLVGATTRR